MNFDVGIYQIMKNWRRNSFITQCFLPDCFPISTLTGTGRSVVRSRKVLVKWTGEEHCRAEVGRASNFINYDESCYDDLNIMIHNVGVDDSAMAQFVYIFMTNIYIVYKISVTGKNKTIREN